MTWSRAAIEASIESRRRHAMMHVKKVDQARASHKPSTKAKQVIAAQGEDRIRKLLGVGPTSRGYPVDAHGRGWGVEVKTLMDNKNNKLTMHPSSMLRKTAWAAAQHAKLHTVAIDARSKNKQMYYKAGVGAFRMTSMKPISSGQLDRIIFG